MNLTGIISISGVPGLSKVVAKTKNGVVCESLADKKRFPIQGADKISALEDISIYTDEGEKPLKEVFVLIKEKEKGGQISIEIKADGAKLRAYFETILPNFDRERVYNSDIKKLLNWYNILLAGGYLEQTEDPAKPEKEEVVEEKSKKSAKTKKEDAEAEPKVKPAKKAAAKKAKKEDSETEPKAKPAKKAAAKKTKKSDE
ncbi:MAG: DUF5606 domain-containing protein [Bacteroidia bacterium]|nr:DUF5606 domain-containing protein [Bacteroidia bacterium]